MSFAEILARQFSLWQYAEFFIRLLVACVCGAAIGYERSKRLKEAGIRTHIIVCCAAALTMIVSKYGFGDLVSPDGAGLYGTKGTDPARLAAQIIGGVSFLGAGIIFRNGNSIKGLTTAAGIWATAGIGLAVGAGMYVVGIFTTVVVAVIQILTHRFTVGVDSMVVGRMHCVVSHSAEFRKALNEYIEEHGMQILEVKIDFLEDGSAAYNLTLRMRHDVTVNDLSEFLESVGDVRDVSFELGV
ncbi:MAG: MgtC/SapB family protein [Oscillospiraceae bacterium]|nr:MgtC/SapB family protein [Oscillospiraceae bacterium]